MKFTSVKRFVPFSLFIVYVSVLFALFFAGGKKYVAVTPPAKYNIVIDAGHGGIDGGVTGVKTKVRESDVNLAIAKKLERLLSGSGFNVVMTRTGSGGLYGVLSSGFKKRDMQKRKQIIQNCNPKAVISVHLNSCGESGRRGAMIYYSDVGDENFSLARAVCDRFNLSEKKARACVAVPGDYFILNVSPCPAVICECGFLSNAEDEALLLTDEYREYIAETIFCGVMDFLI